MSILLSPTPSSAPDPAVAVAGAERIDAFLRTLRELGTAALPRMFVADEGVFAFTQRRVGTTLRLEGTSDRYTAISIIGLAALPEPLPGLPPLAVMCQPLLERVDTASNLGDVALTAWAAVASGCDPGRAFARLEHLETHRRDLPVVDLAWSLRAACLAPGRQTAALRARLAARLLAARNPASGLFRHRTLGGGLRSHVACFADQVYPIQALAAFSQLTGDAGARDAAAACADRICALQGRDGQWWWHYDHRTGKVVEGYPVYAIHQDAMAPMALFELERAGGRSYRDAIDRGLTWLEHAPELDGGSLVDSTAGMVWRKVARREPGKAARRLQAAASRVSSRLRVPALDVAFPAGVIDYEDRPYHWGWFLYAWGA